MLTSQIITNGSSSSEGKSVDARDVMKRVGTEVLCPLQVYQSENDHDNCKVFLNLEIRGLSHSFLIVESLPNSLDHEILIP